MKGPTVVAALVTLASLASAAQRLPDLSGTWTLSSYRGDTSRGSGAPSAERSAASGGRAAGRSAAALRPVPGRRPVGQSISVRQTAESVTIEESFGDDVRRVVYGLGGDESVNVYESVTLKTRSRWEEGRLVTEGTQTISTGQADVIASFKEMRWLTPAGIMVIETTRRIEGRDAITSRAEYSKGSMLSREPLLRR